VSECEGGDGRSAAGGGYRTKNKNPTRQCGEIAGRRTKEIKGLEGNRHHDILRFFQTSQVP